MGKPKCRKIPKLFLVGRGGNCNTHVGNKWVRRLTASKSKAYESLKRSRRGCVAESLVENELRNTIFVTDREAALKLFRSESTRSDDVSKKDSLLKMHDSIDHIRSYPIGSFIEIGYAWTLIVIKRQLRDCKKRTSKLETNRNNGVAQQGIVKTSSFVSNSEGTMGLSFDDEQQTALESQTHSGTALNGQNHYGIGSEPSESQTHSGTALNDQNHYGIGSEPSEQVSTSCGRQTTGLEATQPANLDLEVLFGKQQKPQYGHTLDQAVCRTNEKVFTSGGWQSTGLEEREPLHLNSAVQPFGKQLPPKSSHALQGITFQTNEDIFTSITGRQSTSLEKTQPSNLNAFESWDIGDMPRPLDNDYNDAVGLDGYFTFDQE